MHVRSIKMQVTYICSFKIFNYCIIEPVLSFIACGNGDPNYSSKRLDNG